MWRLIFPRATQGIVYSALWIVIVVDYDAPTPYAVYSILA